ncbi:MAG: GNAT family N-acetyltransferase [Candidatus Gottesmanbacteria bacterium]
MKLNFRKILFKDTKDLAVLHEKNMSGLSTKLGKEYLVKFYQLILSQPEIHICLVATLEEKIIGVIILSQDIKKSHQLIKPKLSLNIYLKFIISLIERKISLLEIINRLKFEIWVEKKIKTPYLYILALYVDKNYQRQGIGKMLISNIEDYKSKQDNIKLYVDVRSDNVDAQNFYQEYKFKVKDKLFGAILMEK